MKRWTACLVAGLLCVATGASVRGAAAVRSVFAIKDAKVYTVSGPMLPRGTVVIRNGLIDSVGTDIPIPPDATILDGNGMSVYPGLIDSFSDTGISPAPSGGGQAYQFPKDFQGALFQTPQGMFPERMLADQVRPDGKNVEIYRNLGITSALVVARDGILTGQSALIDTGDTNIIVKPSVAFHINPAPTNGYPLTLMGVFAVLRQAFSDAEWYRQVWERYNADPRGIQRPEYNRMLEAMGPMAQGRVPSIIHANWKAEIKRAIALADELHLKVIIAGGLEAGSLVDALKSRNIPVLVSVNYSLEKPGAGSREPADSDANELKSLLGNASVLAKGRVRFALQSGFADRPQAFIDNIRKTIENGLSVEEGLRATTLSAAEILGVSGALGSIERGKIANIVVSSGEPFAPKAALRQVFVDGKLFEPPAAPAISSLTSPPPASGAAAAGTAGPAGTAQSGATKKAVVKPGSYITPTAIEVLIKNATVLTVSNGTIKNGSILIRNGKIAAVGANVTASPQAAVIDATGKFVMPGIVDAHSHMAIEGGFNEATSPVTPNVRIADVIRDDDVEIYRALAGGTTIVNVLHGSANVIGGTNAVIKLKWGRPAEEMFFGAPLGIKIALGENPKRSNANTGVNSRFPATRMGVEETLREAFTAARLYMDERDTYEAARGRGENPIPPRRDLKLETLADVLRGKILVHAHCYVESEILMLLHLADEFHFKVNVLHHVLEGYKVAKEIAAHGTAASTFADFWVPKIEGWDAIPYNAAVMKKFGVNVSINSDDDARARRLYEEAARTLHYSSGELTEDDALKMITLNPAMQLGIANRVGSIEPGKDADLVIFNAHPFSSYAHVEMTMIDGQIYFDREQDLKTRGTGETQ